MTIPVKPLNEIQEKSEVSASDKILILDSVSEEARLAPKSELKWDKWDKGDTWAKWATWSKWDKWDTGETWATIVGATFSWNDLIFAKDNWDYVTLSNAKTTLTWPKWDTGNSSTITVWTTSTGLPWSNASVTNAGTSSAAVLNFTIPQGQVWATGNWIESITHSKSWKVTTVVITETNWDTSSFEILDGKDWNSWAWSGDVVWPEGATDWHLAVYDWVTWKLIKDGWAVPTQVTVVDALDSTSTTSALSANQWKVLDDKISTLAGLGKFLSLWDCTTGQPISFPYSTPYAYTTWDYFIIETVSSATPPVNYKPDGSSYTGSASSVTESDEVEVWDVYVYDGTIWLLQSNHWKTVSFWNIAGQPSDNANLDNALNSKQPKVIDVTVTTGASTVAKVGTTTWGSYTPTSWDLLLVNFVNGCSVDNPTLAIDSGTAYNIKIWVNNAGVSTFDLWDTSNSNVKVLMYYNWSSYQVWSTENAEYSSMSTSEWKTGTATATRVITASNLKEIIKYHAVDDTAFGASWDGQTDIAPSKNVVYDKINWMLESQTKVFPMPEVWDDISDIISWLTANKQVILLNNPNSDITYEYYRVYLRYTDTRDILCEKVNIEAWTVTWIWITYSNANIVETADQLTRLIAPSWWTAWQVLTQNGNGRPTWQTPSGWDVVVSSQTGNILQSWMSIWAGTETDYWNLGTYNSNCLYLVIE